MAKLFKWLDKNILKLLLIGYIFFIPLYPKLPFKMVNYTYIAIRLEDFYVAGLLFVFIIQLLRKKIELHRNMIIPIAVFWLCMIVSFIFGFFVQKTIVFSHLGMLHILRRIEYMSVFFVFSSSIKTKDDFLLYVRLILVALALVCIYGTGQKFLGWPAVQTMNPEYAKGYILILDANARISSTFGGHYDLAAYLVLLLPLAIASFFYFQKKWFYFGIIVFAILSLTLTASRISYGAYIISTFAFLLWNRKFRMLVVVAFLTVALTLASGNLTKRLTRTFQEKQIFIDKTTGQTTVPRRLSPDDLPVGDFVLNQQSKADQAQNVTSGVKLNKKDVSDVKLNILDEVRKKAQLEGKKLTKAQEDQLVEDAFKNLKVVKTVLPDISFATRLQVEWPRAIKAFLTYPFFGKGPSTITEATDNDYLRWLGEFGAIGTVAFLTVLGMLGLQLFKKSMKNGEEQLLYSAIVFGFVGLLGNAVYIDVFEASKVAYHLWMIMGVFIGFLALKSETFKKTLKHKKA